MQPMMGTHAQSEVNRAILLEGSPYLRTHEVTHDGHRAVEVRDQKWGAHALGTEARTGECRGPRAAAVVGAGAWDCALGPHQCGRT